MTPTADCEDLAACMLIRGRLLHFRCSDFGVGVTELNGCCRKCAGGRKERVCGEAGPARSLVHGCSIVLATCNRPPAGRSDEPICTAARDLHWFNCRWRQRGCPSATQSRSNEQVATNTLTTGYTEDRLSN